ncbi:ACP phosphodiesterase [Paraferrimonas sp. SM1919]|uniref:acyl carrier protein phosphodiesterase n=1 Tax=Paraferrimonas sp. SM1919 TaxID=2662263 RepID=UPI0013CFEB65|nr:ACP phosphodiesterase [Paraferrimonas sp. SM1919]
MNFLAHCHLAWHTNTDITSNLAGDFVRGSIESLPTSLQQGVLLHRQIDKFTDAHPLFKQACNQLSLNNPRIAPIVIDLLFDHCLAKHWQHYHHQTLPQFSAQVYNNALNHPDVPERLANILPNMQRYDWFNSYREMEGILKAMNGVSRRFSKPNYFSDVADKVMTHQSEIEGMFFEFYKELMGFSLACLTDG